MARTLFPWSLGYKRTRKFPFGGHTCGVAYSKLHALSIMRQERHRYSDARRPVFAMFGPWHGKRRDVTLDVFFFDDND